jgi:exo-beta-1,3-glucanase (GH17 family)
MRGGPPQYSQDGYDYNNNASRQQSQRSAGQASSNYDLPHQYGYDRGYDQFGRDVPADRSPNRRQDPYAAQASPYHDASPSLAPLGAAAFPSGRQTPARSAHSGISDPFEDTHATYGARLDPRLGHVDPNDIMDDGDDGLEYSRPSARGSMLSLGSDRGGRAGAAGATAGGAAAGGIVGGMLGRNRGSANYDPVHNASNTAYQSGGGAGPAYDLGKTGAKEQQSEWLRKQGGSKKKWKWIIIIGVALLIIGGVVGGVVGGLLAGRSNSGGGGSGGGSSSGSGGAAGGGGGLTAEQDASRNGDLNDQSQEIKALMGNPNLHKVFPAVDYTPLSVQYPDCVKWPPSQNNVTRDVAVLSQLTNTIRLYGTDCNQTEMTIHALQQLKLDNTMKIWLGVWQDNNATTNARQLTQMWNILDKYGEKYFKGLIVANEILFREQMTATQLGSLLSAVRTNLTSKGMSLPVATSDLGDKWTASLASMSDYIMANIHPFFAGEPAKSGAGWTYTFWNNQAGSFFKSDKSKNIIAETGWPTGGGTNCGVGDTRTSCPDKSVAGIDELNSFMEGWVCPALANGTNYFWFEMFDEPWKISFNAPGKEWEDKWGLMDVNRNLKSGVKIPDCGGKTIGPA